MSKNEKKKKQKMNKNKHFREEKKSQSQSITKKNTEERCPISLVALWAHSFFMIVIKWGMCSALKKSRYAPNYVVTQKKQMLKSIFSQI